MKKLLFTSLLILVGFVFTTNIFSQAVGDYQSVATGTWATAATWARWDGSSWVTPAPSTPDSTSGVVTVLSTHIVTIDANVGVDQVTVNSGATVIVDCALATLTIATGGMTVNGILTITGNVPTAAPYNVVSVGTLTIGATGVVNINETAAVTSTKGFLPTATWLAGSTLNVNSKGGAGATGWGAGNSQNFGTINVNWTSATQNSANFGWGFSHDAVNGDFNVLATGTGRIQLFGGSSGYVQINGKLTVSGGQLTGSGTSGASTIDTVVVMGDVSVTGGAFSVDRGGHNNANDGSGVKWYFYGNNVTIAPTSTANGMANSNSQGGILPFALDSRFIMAKAGAQNLKIAPALCTSSWGISVELINGAQVTLSAPSNIIYLILTSGNIIAPTASPLVMGWDNAGSIYSGTIADLNGAANADDNNNVIGKLGFLVGSTSPTTKVYPIAKGGVYRPLTLSLTQSTTTASNYYAEMFNSAPIANTLPGTLDKVSSVRYYTISEGAGGSAFTAGAVTLSYGTDDLVSDALNLRVAQGPVGGGTWIDLGGTGSASPIGTILSTVAFTDLTTNTVFTLANATGGTNALPVELTSFIAAAKDGVVELAWTTATETNNYGWDIEMRKNSETSWERIGFISGAGNSNSAKKYSFVDKSANQSGSYSYRLKQMDMDGKFSYSNEVTVKVETPITYSLGQNYPNPFNPSTNIDYTLPADSKVTLAVYSLIGEKVADLVNEEQASGYYSYQFSSRVLNLTSGIYLYKLTAVSKSNEVFSQSRKMLLLK